MKFSDFKNFINEGNVPKIVLMEGEETFLSKTGVSLLVDKFVKEPSLNYSVLTEADEKEVLSSVMSLPFLSDYRLTRVNEFYPKSLDFLSEFLSENTVGSILVICNEKPSETLKKIPDITLVECVKSQPQTLAHYVKQKCLESGVEIELETALTVCEYSLCDLTRIENEIIKLCAYCRDTKKITKEDVSDLVYKDAEYKIYELTDCIAKKNADKSIEIVFDMLSRGETPQKIIVSMYNYFRRLLHISISRESDQTLSKAFSVKEYAVKKAREQAKMFSPKSLKSAVDTLCDVDYKFKSGSLNVSNAMWYSLFKILCE